MPRLFLALPCAVALACTPPAASLDELRDAVPGPELLSMSIAARHAPPAPTCTPSEPSSFGSAAHDVAAMVDGLTSGVLGLVDQVRSQPPTAHDGGTAMWGPLEGETADYTLAVEQLSATEFQFFLGGKPKGSDDEPQGVFGGRSSVTDAQHRSGEVQLNFTVLHALDASWDPVEGGVAIEYVVDDHGRAVESNFGGILGKDNPEPTDAYYAFDEAPDQSMGLAFLTHLDFDADGATDEQLHIATRNTADGSGMATVTVQGGSLGATEVHAVECWDASLGRVYFADDLNDGESGSEACCPF